MSVQTQLQTPLLNSLSENYLKKVPNDVLKIFIEFKGDGYKSQIYNKFYVIHQIKHIVEAGRLYSLSFRLAINHINTSSVYTKAIPALNVRENSKYILNSKPFVSFCDCEQPCCYRFQYTKENKYICGCHEKQSANFACKYGINKTEYLKVTPSKYGFCVKITDL
jgi:hypothetical protein